MTLAMVNVLPEPVTPSRTWCCSRSKSPRVSASIAVPWSPLGLYELTNLNSMKSAAHLTGRNFVGWASHHYRYRVPGERFAGKTQKPLPQRTLIRLLRCTQSLRAGFVSQGKAIEVEGDAVGA